MAGIVAAKMRKQKENKGNIRSSIRVSKNRFTFTVVLSVFIPSVPSAS
jgi:hypothetical protein